MKKAPVLFAALICLICSCKQDGSQYSDQIIGKWKITSADSKNILTNNSNVLTFTSKSVFITTTYTSRGRMSWRNAEKHDYTLSGDHLSFSGDKTSVDATIGSISANSLVFKHFTHNRVEGNLELENVVYAKVNDDFSEKILGLWEGVEFSGENTFGDANHRWKYTPDGKYRYYTWDEATSSWNTKEQSVNDYIVDGNLFISHWIDSFGNDCFESWEMTKCDDSEMEWYALRENIDGKQIATTFKMKKISE